jgi:hypothetical protein
MTITIHQVLAGAYRGRDLARRPMLTHASADGGDTALCGRVANLCDLAVAGPPTCKMCEKLASQETR